MLAFDLADKYRNPAVILGDAVLGQMQETMADRPYQPLPLPPKDWVLNGASGRATRLIKSLYLKEGEMEKQPIQVIEGELAGFDAGPVRLRARAIRPSDPRRASARKLK